MGTKLTQAVVNRIAEEHQAGSQVYDEDVAGLRIVVGSKSASYKLVGRINDGSDRYVSIMVGRTDAVGGGGACGHAPYGLLGINFADRILSQILPAGARNPDFSH